jgi:hypothetical protein
MRVRDFKNWAALGGAGGLMIASPALAQTATTTSMSIVDNPSVSQASAHYKVNGTVEEEYQSNVAGGNAAVAALRGLKRDDFIFTPTALLDLFKPLGRESIYLDGSVGYNVFARNHVLDRENLNLSGGVNGELSACRATLTGAYIRGQKELQDITRSKVQDTLETASVGLNGVCGRGHGLQPTFSVSQSWTNNSLAQLNSQDYNTLGGSGGLDYVGPTFGTLSLFGQYQTTDFTNRILMVDLSAFHDGFDTYGGGVRYVRQLGARIQGTVSVSYTSVKPFIGTTSGFNGLTYGADLTYRASGRLSFHGSVTRDVQPSNVFNATYFLETKSVVEANYSAGSRLRLNLGASEQDRTFEGADLTAITDLKSDSYKSLYGSITYALRKFYLTLNASNNLRTANIAGLSYTDNRIGLTAGTSF